MDDIKPIAEIIVNDGSSDIPQVNVILPSNDGVPWCILCQFGSSFYAYNFQEMMFVGIGHNKYQEYLKSCHSIQIKSNQSKNSEWIIWPISSGKPRLVFDSVIPRSEAKPKRRKIINPIQSSELAKRV